MIIKKTVTISLLILSLVWQGTSLYGMLPRLAVQKSTKPFSRELSKLMTRRCYCGKKTDSKTDPMKDDLLYFLKKDVASIREYMASIKESVDWIGRPKKWYQSVPVGVFSIAGAALLYEYQSNRIRLYFSKLHLSNVDHSITDSNQDSGNGGSEIDNTNQDDDDAVSAESPE